MGKNKGGGFNLFESYLASGLAAQEGGSTDQHIPLPDSMRTTTLLEQIGQDRKWSEEQIEVDIAILESNRLYYVSDLRELSKSSWKAIDLLPLVKDLLRNALDPTEKENIKDKKDKKSKKDKKKYKKEKKEAKKEAKRMKLGEPVVSGPIIKDDMVALDPETIRNTIQNIKAVQGDTAAQSKPDKKEKKDKKKNKSVSFSKDDPAKMNGDCSGSSSSSSSSSSSNSDSECDDKSCKPTEMKPKVFTGRPIQAVSANRIRVQTVDGVYEADRFCPHKKVDLSTWGQVIGNTLICSKHNWKFNLDNGSVGTKGRSINPCKVNDW